MGYQVGFHTQHNGLRFWITKAAVIFQYLRDTLFIDHDASIEEAGVR